MENIDFKDTTPIYIQIINIVKKSIATGVLKEGEKMPSVREMSLKMKVNPNTVQRAYQELEREGISFTQRGMGTFITEDTDRLTLVKNELAENVINTFLKGMKSIGFDYNDMLEMLNQHIKGVE